MPRLLFRGLLAVAWLPFLAHLALDDDGLLISMLHALTGWWAPVGAVLLGVGLAARWWPEAVASAPLAALWLAWTVPGTLGGGVAAHGEGLRVVSANVLMVHPDPGPLRDEILSYDPDVILLQEVSQRWVEAFGPALGAYPHHVFLPAEHSFGQAVLSRRPLLESVEHDLYGVPMIEVSVALGEGRLRLVNVHTLPPRTAEYAAAWHGQMREVASLFAGSEDPLLIAADLNATRHHPSYRSLLEGAGLRDAHAAVGRAAARTWPNGLFPVPPLRLDHVLVSDQLQVVSVREGRALGSDHSPVVVEVALR